MGAPSVIGLAVVCFVSTNIDNLLVTTAQLALTAEAKRRAVIAGQLAGFGIIVAASVLGAWLVADVPIRWIGLLGLAPITLGIRELVAHRRPEDAEPALESALPKASGFVSSALITLGNGGDNLAVYIPVLRRSGAAEGALFVLCLLAFDVLLCGGALALGRHRRTRMAVQRLGSSVKPVVYIVIGVIIVVRSGTLSHLI
jgi:cadmium resistance protein CadD (predicted permease)